MFERMEGNRVPCLQLTTQRRMTPQICQFVMPIYPNQLVSDDSVKIRKLKTALGDKCLAAGETIPGMCKSIFFWNHNVPEVKSTIGMSMMNSAEVQMAYALLHYLTNCCGMSLRKH